MSKNTYQFGIIHEQEAILELKNQGFEIVKTRYKTKFGEIDVIAKKNDLLVFVEVKSRRNEELIEVILRPNQVKRIKDSASYFLSKNQEYYNFNFRFDFILFIENQKMQHFESYF